eukprot:TRINITY_DN2316_c0_g1_i1.p1 TRINITY_DN2316_c0_g1~~TRINITY_DN2316_c0_g1_i1.p1  ORF type:complete len:571 (+),score=142.20 TRINITY_DN2316_c0_g1_i1:40-1752(+)
MSDNPFGATLKKVGPRSDTPNTDAPKDDKPPKSPFLKNADADDKPPRSPFLKKEMESPASGVKSPFLSKAEEPSRASVSVAESSSPFGPKKSRQSLEAPPSGKESPVGRDSADLDKSVVSMAKTEGTAQPAMSRKESAASVRSAQSAKSGGAPVSRQGSRLSATEQSPEIAIEEALSEHGSRAPSRQPSVQSLARSVQSVHTAAPTNAELVNENERLKAQIESLQRLMASGNQDTKIHRLQEDLKERALKVKELEQELKKAKDENAKLKQEVGAKKGKKAKDTPDTTTYHDSRIIAEKDEQIEELQRQVTLLREEARRGSVTDPAELTRRLSHASSHSDGPAPARPKSSEVRTEVRYDQAAIQEVKVLKQKLTERDAVIQQLNLKLERAQEAILSSAGVGWEAHVKLHQTKGMLGKMLRAASPEGGRQKSVSVPREGSQTPSGPVVDFKATEDETGKMRLFKYMNGEKAYISNLRYANGAVYDQTGSVMPLGEKGRDELPRLAALADMCGVPHNIPSSQPIVVVAGHNVAAPNSPTSPYSTRAGSARGNSPIYGSPHDTSRYRSPTRRGY